MTAYSRKFKLSQVDALPRVTIVNPPNMILSHNVASGSVVPGELVEPVGVSHSDNIHTVGGFVQTVAGKPSSAFKGLRRYSVAMRPVEVFNELESTTTPVDVVNRTIAAGEFVRQVYDGILMTTLAKPTVAGYQSGDLLTWDGSATRPTGISGTGAWQLAASDEPLAEVVSFKEVDATSHDGILEFRLLA